jgi:hypothetical protein
MFEVSIRGPAPTEALVDAVYVAAQALGVWECYAYEGRYHFMLGGGWSVAISCDSAERICVESCRLGRPEARMWTLAYRHDRLAGLVERMGSVPEAA